MNDKRRRHRVQGAWGGTSSSRKREEPKDGQHNDYPPINRFCYNPTKNVIRNKPADITFDKSGKYKLSSTDNGVSGIDLDYEFIEPGECDWIFEHLQNNIPWKQENIVIKGEVKSQPRLTCWYGDIEYTYSGLTLTPYQFSPVLVMLREKIEKKTNLLYNSMLANLYRNEKDSVDWHSDDEVSLGKNPVIASLSFGDMRLFEMRQKSLDKGDYTYSQHVKIPLSTGCLLVMYGAAQDDWQHHVPKEYHDRGTRINLTFRQIYPQSNSS